MVASYAPVNAMPVVAGSAPLAQVSAIPVVVVSDGSVAVAPINAQAVVQVSAAFPLAQVQPIPIVYPAGSPAVSPEQAIPVFVVGTVP